MRVTAGIYKGRQIEIPRTPDLRPTKDVVKQAIFNILGEKVRGALVADIYAGSGALGIEALSRGARFCDFVEMNKGATETIRKNIKALSLTDRARVWREMAIKFLDERGANHYHLILLDPPYNLTSLTHALNLCGEVVKPEGAVVLEHHRQVALKGEYATLVAVNQRKYGQTAITFFRKKG